MANNGLEALQALRRQQYDVVFMDMHMPEMDGVDASQRIQETIPWYERPWIVALTANAMQSDRDVCARAGMDDFLSKPIQANDVRTALLKVARTPGPQAPDIRVQPVGADSGENAAAGSGLEAGPDASEAGPCAIDDTGEEGVEEASGEPSWSIPDYLAEMMSDEPDMGADLLRLFLEDSSKSVAALRDAVSKRDADGTARILHSLKGSCAQMGGMAMANLCLRMEQGGLEGNAAGMVEVESQFNFLRKAMEASIAP